MHPDEILVLVILGLMFVGILFGVAMYYGRQSIRNRNGAAAPAPPPIIGPMPAVRTMPETPPPKKARSVKVESQNRSMAVTIDPPSENGGNGWTLQRWEANGENRMKKINGPNRVFRGETPTQNQVRNLAHKELRKQADKSKNWSRSMFQWFYD